MDGYRCSQARYAHATPIWTVAHSSLCPVLLLKVTRRLSQCQNQGEVLWKHIHFDSICSSWTTLFSCDLEDGCPTHSISGHVTELPFLCLIHGLHEGPAEEHAPGLVLLPLTWWEWRHASFGILLISIYLIQILTDWVLAGRVLANICQHSNLKQVTPLTLSIWLCFVLGMHWYACACTCTQLLLSLQSEKRSVMDIYLFQIISETLLLLLRSQMNSN